MVDREISTSIDKRHYFFSSRNSFFDGEIKRETGKVTYRHRCRIKQFVEDLEEMSF